MSSNLTVQGLKVKNSPKFHLRFDVCQYVDIELLNINSPAQSPNTDGIHIENTKNVKIYNSVISNGNYTDINFHVSTMFYFRDSQCFLVIYFPCIGDDCVSIGAGCYNVDIRNITCGPSHGIR